MKKIKSWKELKKGGIYNRVYVGKNKIYAKINGKETFEVLEKEPILRIQILFGVSGNPLNPKTGNNELKWTALSRH
jgi:hypothetical protein